MMLHLRETKSGSDSFMTHIWHVTADKHTHYSAIAIQQRIIWLKNNLSGVRKGDWGLFTPNSLVPHCFLVSVRSQSEPILVRPLDCNGLGVVSHLSSSKYVSYPRMPGRHLREGKGFCFWGDFWGPLLVLFLGREGSLRAEIHSATLQWPDEETGAPFSAMELFHFILYVFYQCFHTCCLLWAVYLCFIIGSSKEFFKEAE